MIRGHRLENVYVCHKDALGGFFIDCSVITVRFGRIEFYHYTNFYLPDHPGNDGKPFRSLPIEEFSVTI